MELIKTKIHWIEICTYHPDVGISEHEHSFFHYIYVIKGVGNITIDGKIYEFKSKQMYLISPKIRHSFYNTGTSELVTFEMKFDLLDAHFTDKVMKLPDVIDVRNTPIQSIMKNIHREIHNGAEDCKEIITMNMHEIFIHMQRAYDTFKIDDSPDNQKVMLDVIEYIGANLDKELNLQELADVVSFDKIYFLKKFKKLTGITPMEYIRNVRMEKAKELLVYSDMNITQVAECVGFRSIHHFSNCFSKYTGMTPSKFKKDKYI